MHPTVRYLIVCEDVQTDPVNPRRITLAGLMSAIRSLDEPPFPLLYREICVFLQLTECRGPGAGHIEIRHADSDRVVLQTSPQALALSRDPLEVVGAVFRIRNILFPEAGLYWIEFWYNSQRISQQPLVLR